jgi:hypothetical protein
MSTKNARTLGIRLDEHTNARLLRFEAATLIEGVSLARAALIAALDAYEADNSLTLPLRITDSRPPPLGPLPPRTEITSYPLVKIKPTRRSD